MRKKKETPKSGVSNTDKPPPRPSQLVNYAWTLFDYEEKIGDMEISLNELCTKWGYGKEICPDTKAPHLQGFMCLKKRRRITEFKDKFHKSMSFRAWYDKSNLQFNIKYCMKDGDFKSFGLKLEDYPEEEYLGTDLPKPDQLYSWQRNILDIINTEPDTRTVHWFWESDGNVGKSTFTKYLGFHHNALVCQKGKYGDIMNHAYMKINLKIFIIDVPRSNMNHVSYDAIESIKSGIIVNNKYETGRKYINPPHMIVFANYPPDKSKLSEDRWKVICIGKTIEESDTESDNDSLDL